MALADRRRVRAIGLRCAAPRLRAMRGAAIRCSRVRRIASRGQSNDHVRERTIRANRSRTFLWLLLDGDRVCEQIFAFEPQVSGKIWRARRYAAHRMQISLLSRLCAPSSRRHDRRSRACRRALAFAPAKSRFDDRQKGGGAIAHRRLFPSTSCRFFLCHFCTWRLWSRASAALSDFRCRCLPPSDTRASS